MWWVVSAGSSPRWTGTARERARREHETPSEGLLCDWRRRQQKCCRPLLGAAQSRGVFQKGSRILDFRVSFDWE